MGMLCERTAEALGRSDEATADRLTIVQRNFLEDHLAAWYPVFTADIRHFAKTRFYQGLATLTDGFLEQESAFLAELLDTEE